MTAFMNGLSFQGSPTNAFNTSVDYCEARLLLDVQVSSGSYLLQQAANARVKVVGLSPRGVDSSFVTAQTCTYRPAAERS